MSFHKVWKHLIGEGETGREGLGRDYCIQGGWWWCWWIRGQSCLAPAHPTVREAKPSSGWGGGPRLNVRLNPLRGFQSKPSARAHRISAWSHGRAQPPLGKADTTRGLSEAELNGPRRPHPWSRGGLCGSHTNTIPLWVREGGGGGVGRGAARCVWHGVEHDWNT